MSKYHSPDNFNGNMRTDANHGGKPLYFPNSYHTHKHGAPSNTSMSKKVTPGFDPSVAEAPYQVMNNVVSRESVYKHEGDASEYKQVRELYQVGSHSRTQLGQKLIVFSCSA
jgi:catalase